MTIRRNLVIAMLLLLVPAVARAEQIDNPSYQAWAKQKPGAKVSYKTDTAASGMAMAMDLTMTLKEIKPDKAIVEYSMKMDMGGMVQQMPPRTQEVPAKVEKGQESLPADMKGTSKDLGKETVEAMGKKFECSVHSFTGESAGGRSGPPGTSTGKTWSSTEIPGGLVKMEMEMVSGQMTATTKMTLTAFEEGK